MDIWLTDEVWWRYARIEGEGPFNCARFAIYCLFGSIVGGELLYILIKTARGGQRIAPFNLMIPVLGFLLAQFIILVSAMWLSYAPWRPVYPVCAGSYTAFPSYPLKFYCFPDCCQLRARPRNVLFHLDSAGTGRSNNSPPFNHVQGYGQYWQSCQPQCRENQESHRLGVHRIIRCHKPRQKRIMGCAYGVLR